LGQPGLAGLVALADRALPELRLEPPLVALQLVQQQVVLAQNRSLVGDRQCALGAHLTEHFDKALAAGGKRASATGRIRRRRGRLGPAACDSRLQRCCVAVGPALRPLGRAIGHGVSCGRRCGLRESGRPGEQAAPDFQPADQASTPLRKPFAKAELKTLSNAELPEPPESLSSESTSPPASWPSIGLPV